MPAMLLPKKLGQPCKRRSALDGWQKFCGRCEKQDPNTFEMYCIMDDYCQRIRLVAERERLIISNAL